MAERTFSGLGAALAAAITTPGFAGGVADSPQPMRRTTVASVRASTESRIYKIAKLHITRPRRPPGLPSSEAQPVGGVGRPPSRFVNAHRARNVGRRRLPKQRPVLLDHLAQLGGWAQQQRLQSGRRDRESADGEDAQPARRAVELVR